MSSIVDTRRRLNSARTLQGVVTTMKTLSAVRITQYRRSVAALRQSTRTLELAVQALLQLRPELLTGAQASTGSSVTLVALGTDRGLCGPFNERITGHTTGLLRARLPAGQEPTILAVGRRLETRLTAVGHEPTAQVSPDRKSTRLKLQSRGHLVCRLLLEKKNKTNAKCLLCRGQ